MRIKVSIYFLNFGMTAVIFIKMMPRYIKVVINCRMKPRQLVKNYRVDFQY